MSLWKIAWRSIQQRSLASFLTALSMALGVALVVCVLVIYSTIKATFTENASLGYDMIVGAKGGKTDLVLNTVYHLSQPVENIPWSYYKEFTEGKYKSSAAFAIPMCMGDNYQGYRVVGTIPEMFGDYEYQQGRKYAFQEGGRNFKHENFFEAVIGSLVARRTGLKVGDKFAPTHGIVNDGSGHEHDPFTVVGILEPTGTPNDRALFVNMEGFFLLEGHAMTTPREGMEPAGDDHHGDAEHKGDEPAAKGEPDAAGHADHEEHHDHGDSEGQKYVPLPEDEREVTAILIRSAHPLAMISLPKLINKGPYAQVVSPVREINKLFDSILGGVDVLLLSLAVLVVVVAGIGIMVSIYNSMHERQREIAIMRALGAGRTTVLSVILLESILLSLGGGLAGWALGHGVIFAISGYIFDQTGVTIGLFQTQAQEIFLIPGLIVLASLVGYLPAMAAYRTDVSKSLSRTP